MSRSLNKYDLVEHIKKDSWDINEFICHLYQEDTHQRIDVASGESKSVRITKYNTPLYSLIYKAFKNEEIPYVSNISTIDCNENGHFSQDFKATPRDFIEWAIETQEIKLPTSLLDLTNYDYWNQQRRWECHTAVAILISPKCPLPYEIKNAFEGKDGEKFISQFSDLYHADRQAVLSDSDKDKYLKSPTEVRGFASKLNITIPYKKDNGKSENEIKEIILHFYNSSESLESKVKSFNLAPRKESLPNISPSNSENWKDDVKAAYNNYYNDNAAAPKADDLRKFINSKIKDDKLSYEFILSPIKRNGDGLKIRTNSGLKQTITYKTFQNVVSEIKNSKY